MGDIIYNDIYLWYDIRMPETDTNPFQRPFLLTTLLVIIVLLWFLIFAILEWIRFANLTRPPVTCVGNAADCAMVQETIAALPGQGEHVRSVAFRYDHPTDLGGFTTVDGDLWIGGDFTPQQKRTLLIHEYGHVVDFFQLLGTPGRSTSPFTVRYLPVFPSDPSLDFYQISWDGALKLKSGARAGDFVTTYARRSAIEDFAESYAYYVIRPEAFEQRAAKNPVLKQKLEYIRNLFPSDFTVVQNTPWDGLLPRVTTDLAYQWQTSVAMGQ